MQVIQKLHLKSKLIIDRVTFDKLSSKWNYVAFKIHVFVHGKAHCAFWTLKGYIGTNFMTNF